MRRMSVFFLQPRSVKCWVFALYVAYTGARTGFITPRALCGDFVGTQGAREGDLGRYRRTWKVFSDSSNGCKFALKVNACVFLDAGVYLVSGGADGTRTRDLRRDRPAF